MGVGRGAWEGRGGRERQSHRQRFFKEYFVVKHLYLYLLLQGVQYSFVVVAKSIIISTYLYHQKHTGVCFLKNKNKKT